MIYMHKKIMQRAEKALRKDAEHYEKKEKAAKKHHNAKKAQQEHTERKEAQSAAKDLKKRVKKAHEY
jgi:hypothetical protein